MKYQNYEKMIRMVVFHYYLKTGIEYDDILGEANLIYCKAQTTHNPELSKFSTYLYTGLKQGLQTFIYHELKRNKLMDNLFILSDMYSNDTYKEKVSISSEVIQIIDMIIEKKDEIIAFTKRKYTGKVSQYTLWKYLLHKGWKWKTVDTAFTEIKYLLSEGLV